MTLTGSTGMPSQTLQTHDIPIRFIDLFYRYRSPNYEHILHEFGLICVSLLPYKDVTHKNKKKTGFLSTYMPI